MRREGAAMRRPYEKRSPVPNCSFGASLYLGRSSAILTTRFTYQTCLTGLKESGRPAGNKKLFTFTPMPACFAGSSEIP